jgi:curved DNA-binding protein CbpA
MNPKSGSDSTFYEILEVLPSATGREIHTAYMRAKETYSPDSPALYSMFSPEEARELLKVIDEAFSVLSNQTKRQEYDLKLARAGHSAFATLLMNDPRATKSPSRHERPIVGEEGVKLKNSRPIQYGREGLPEGFAKTRFGIYETDPVFEKQLADIEECDGQFLQKVRQYKKVNLEDLSDATRISKSFLGAIESNAFEALPAPVFVRGFVLQVARTLHVPDRLADAYMKHFRKHIG